MTHQFYQKIRSLFEKENPTATRRSVLESWLIGRRLHLESKRRFWISAEFKAITTELAQRLNTDLLLSQNRPVKNTDLRTYAQLFAAFPNARFIHPELSFSHYRQLLRLKVTKERNYYLHQARQQHWTTAQLRRQIHADTWQRQTKSEELTAASTACQLPEIKSPYLLEFLKINPKKPYKERDLETALVRNLADFLLELGNGYTFVARQKLLATLSGKKFFVDLVFYNHLQKCFVLIDLKAEPLDHRALGQMDMYLRLFDYYWRQPDDNPTVGLILCPKIDPIFQKFSLLNAKNQVFASTFQLTTKK
jgi:predicted nuclease of restriction endonuclease-like (RecB) superfamily